VASVGSVGSALLLLRKEDSVLLPLAASVISEPSVALAALEPLRLRRAVSVDSALLQLRRLASALPPSVVSVISEPSVDSVLVLLRSLVSAVLPLLRLRSLVSAVLPLLRLRSLVSVALPLVLLLSPASVALPLVLLLNSASVVLLLVRLLLVRLPSPASVALATSVPHPLARFPASAALP
jgi:hypothetical protein